MIYPYDLCVFHYLCFNSIEIHSHNDYKNQGISINWFQAPVYIFSECKEHRPVSLLYTMKVYKSTPSRMWDIPYGKWSLVF